MKIRLWLGLMLLMALNSSFAAADRFEDEINNYISIFQTGTPEQQLLACQQLEGAGLSDHRLFDVIDHHKLDGNSGRLQVKAELFFKSFWYRRIELGRSRAAGSASEMRPRRFERPTFGFGE